MINSYDFGKINIDGKEYTHDLIIHTNSEIEDWWRQDSHNVTKEEVEPIIRDSPEMVIIGTGYSGIMRVSKEAREVLKSSGVEVIIEDSRKACEDYNKFTEGDEKVVIALHLTC